MTEGRVRQRPDPGGTGWTLFSAQRRGSAALSLSYSDWLKDTVEYLEHDIRRAMSDVLMAAVEPPYVTVTVEVQQFGAEQ